MLALEALVAPYLSHHFLLSLSCPSSRAKLCHCRTSWTLKESPLPGLPRTHGPHSVGMWGLDRLSSSPAGGRRSKTGIRGWLKPLQRHLLNDREGTQSRRRLPWGWQGSGTIEGLHTHRKGQTRRISSRASLLETKISSPWPPCAFHEVLRRILRMLQFEKDLPPRQVLLA